MLPSKHVLMFILHESKSQFTAKFQLKSSALAIFSVKDFIPFSVFLIEKSIKTVLLLFCVSLFLIKQDFCKFTYLFLFIFQCAASHWLIILSITVEKASIVTSKIFFD